MPAGRPGRRTPQQTNAYDSQLAASLTALLGPRGRRGQRRRAGQCPPQLQPEPDHHQRAPAERAGSAGDGPDRAEHIQQHVQRDGHAAFGRAGFEPGSDHDRREWHLLDDQFPDHQRRGTGHADREAGAGTGRADLGGRAAQCLQEGQRGAGPVAGDRRRGVEHGQRRPTRRHVDALRGSGELPERRARCRLRLGTPPAAARARRRDRRPGAPDRRDGGRHPDGRQAPPPAVPGDRRWASSVRWHR